MTIYSDKLYGIQQKGTVRETWCHKATGAKDFMISMSASYRYPNEEEKVMKTRNVTKILTGLAAVSLVLGTTSLVSAKGADHGKSGHKEKVEKVEKAKDKKKENKKKTVIKSKAGKIVEKRLNSVNKNVSAITKSINIFFGVNEDGTTEKELSEKTASKKYKSYKGKLKAEINKLRTINKQLKSLNKKNRLSESDYEALIKKSEELEQLAKDEIDRVESLAEQASTTKEDSEQTNATDEQKDSDGQEDTEDAKEQTESDDQIDSGDTDDQSDAEEQTQTDDTSDQPSTVDIATPTVPAQ